MNIYTLLFLFFIVAPISTFIHESGHAVGAKLANADRITITIGNGKKVISFWCNGICINVHMFYFIGGFIASDRAIDYVKKDLILIAACGPISSGIFAFIFYLGYGMVPNSYIYLLFLFNLWIAVVNSIPFQIKQKQSDGYTILNTIIQRK